MLRVLVKEFTSRKVATTRNGGQRTLALPPAPSTRSLRSYGKFGFASRSTSGSGQQRWSPYTPPLA
jgi:hypothetical protein